MIEKSLIEQYKDALNLAFMFKQVAEQYEHEAEDLKLLIEKEKKYGTNNKLDKS